MRNYYNGKSFPTAIPAASGDVWDGRQKMRIRRQDMTAIKRKITVIGNSVVDVLAGPIDVRTLTAGSQPVKETKLSFGGDALNESVLLSRFGKRVELISRLGRDEAGSRVMDYLKENGVSTDHILAREESPTSVNIVLVDQAGERYFLTNPGSSQRMLSEEDIEPYLDEAADLVSFASIFVSAALDIPAMERIFRRVKSRLGRILVADMTKAKHRERLEDLAGLLPLVDYILPNEAEAALLTGEKDPYENARRFVDAGVGCAVIKTGSQGCLIHTKQQTLRIPAFPVRECVDTTGAGDSFAAGFLWGLSEGFSLADCGRLACASASCSVERMGATEGIRSPEQVLERFREMKKAE
ncbi:MAG: carbohydrate kinase family protein [Clostridiales bacterium]|nr:carbohydrate kinase family protein [Clostridiales bacterium]